jgi:hypothetical protein
MARTDCGRPRHSAQDTDLGLSKSISPDCLAVYDKSAEGRRLRSASGEGYEREEW